jgi:hypothetical protein
LTTQGAKEIVETKKEIIKEGVEVKEASHIFIQGWGSERQA